MERFTSRLKYDMSWPAKLNTQNGLSLDFSKPPEYRGMHDTLTPEDAFVGAAITCIACTFDTFASKMRLKIDGLELEGTGTVDRVDGVLKFSELEVRVTIRIPKETNRDSVQRAFEKARDGCLVTASMNVPIRYNLEICQG